MDKMTRRKSNSEIACFLKEDLGRYGDITSKALIGNEKAVAVIIARKDCVLAGLEEAADVFGALGLKIERRAKDGRNVKAGSVVLKVKGKARSILEGERLALNFLMRMSGIATITHELVEKCRKVNRRVQIACTRKTTPGFRFYEKKAVLIGGGISYRQGLFDGMLIKDNHLRIVGSVRKAVEKVKRFGEVEIEVENMDDAIEAVKGGANIIMLDNRPPEEARAISERVRKIAKRFGMEVRIEISGGITPDNILDYAGFADIISLGWITHSAKAVDFSLDIKSVES